MDAKKARNLVKDRCALLRECGFLPLLFSPIDERESLARKLGSYSIAGGFFPRNIHDPVKTSREFEAWLLERNIDQSVSSIADTAWIHPHDDWTETVLQIADRFGFRTPDGYRNCRVKPKARDLIASHKKVPQPGFRKVSLGSIQTCFSDETSCKTFVAKPIVGAGSSWVSRLLNSDDAKQYDESRSKWISTNSYQVISNSFFDLDPNVDLLVEEYIPGSVFQVDGFVSDGTCFICDVGIKRHVTNPGIWSQGFSETGGITCFANREDSFVKRLVDWTKLVVKAVDLNNSAFHIEGVRRDDKLHVIEVNPRVGGSEVARIANFISGVDLHSEMTRLAVGVPNQRIPKPTSIFGIAYCLVQPEKGRGLGEITHLVPRTTTQLEVFGKVRSCEWRPFHGVKLKTVVGKVPHEEYLAELHVFFEEEVPSGSWDEIASQVSQLEEINKFIQICYDR
ncbi:ATP-grasp domain-containing protein [Thalassoglobus sp.]|uniref:ATP-grasp domain-containing protein n=1 Tax=Thalassoglobus sp. TaxID=2795869 RepID=UPI003AA7D676